ncbi:UDP-2,3-diacylglucosamine hydrolase, partial [Haemophilus influenzae]
KKLCINFKNG